MYRWAAATATSAISMIYVSGDANDLNTYIPFMEGYHRAYGCFPRKTPADAGYGSYDNYCYCKEHDIELYVKYIPCTKNRKRSRTRTGSGAIG